MVIESGVIIFLGLLFIFVKLPRPSCCACSATRWRSTWSVSAAVTCTLGHVQRRDGRRRCGPHVLGLYRGGPLGHWVYRGRNVVPGVFTRRPS